MPDHKAELIRLFDGSSRMICRVCGTDLMKTTDCGGCVGTGTSDHASMLELLSRVDIRRRLIEEPRDADNRS
jgi:predicted amidophosphoribosyltransferase